MRLMKWFGMLEPVADALSTMIDVQVVQAEHSWPLARTRRLKIGVENFFIT
jgi:hypothetical protein